MKLQNKPGKLGEMATAIGKLGVQIIGVNIEDEEEDCLIVQFTLNLSKNNDAKDVLANIKAIPGVRLVSY